MQVKDVLVEAKNLMVDRGWIQGNYVTGEGFCSLGALDEVVMKKFYGDFITDDEAAFLVEEARFTLERSLKAKGRVTNVAAWNDARHRTFQDVRDLFDDAARVAGA